MQDAETRARFEAIVGNDPDAVRARMRVLGLDARFTPAEFEELVMMEVRRLSGTASTPADGSPLVASPKVIRDLTPTVVSEPTSAPPPMPPREFECSVCEDARWMAVTRDRNDPRFGKPVPCRDCTPEWELIAYAEVPERFREARPDAEALKVHPGNEAAVREVLAWDGETSFVFASRGLPDDSDWGTGKTHLACAMLIGKVLAGERGKFLEAATFLAQIKARFDQPSEAVETYIAQIANEPLLLIDDLGKEQATDWARAQLHRLFDLRYQRRATTIVTTNYHHPGELAQSVGGSVASRLREYRWVLVGGEDWRGSI